MQYWHYNYIFVENKYNMNKRTLQSRKITTVETADVAGFTTTFTFSQDEGQEKPTGVSASGYKTEGVTTINFSASQTENGYSIQFMNGKSDAAVEKEIRAQFDDILK